MILPYDHSPLVNGRKRLVKHETFRKWEVKVQMHKNTTMTIEIVLKIDRLYGALPYPVKFL